MTEAAVPDPSNRVGVIGTGNMGTAMARRLLDAGRDLVVYDTSPASVEPLVERGATAADSVGDLATQCRVVVTSLPGPDEVESVACELAAVGAARSLHVSHSTVSVDCARRVAQLADGYEGLFLDAPVSGGAMGVAAGTLTVLASGAPEALEMGRPVLEAYAQRILDLGSEPGIGTLAKLVNNAIFLCSGLVHQEAVALAAKAGMDPATLDAVLESSSAALYLGLAGPTLTRQWERIGFSTALAEKDVRLALDSASSLGVQMPVIAAAHDHYQRAVVAGLGAQDFPATLAAVEQLSNVQVPVRPTKETPLNPARRAAEQYVAQVNAVDLDALVGLFAEDAVVLHPLGVFEGIDAVREFYATNILPHRPALTASGWVVEGSTCVFELEASTPGGSSHAIDHCTVDGEGRIRRMAIAYR